MVAKFSHKKTPFSNSTLFTLHLFETTFQNFHIKRHPFPIQLSSLYIYLKQPFLTQSHLFETTFLNPINIFKIFVHLHNISYFANLLQIILSNYSLSLHYVTSKKRK